MSISQKMRDALRKATDTELSHRQAVRDISEEFAELNDRPEIMLLASVMKGVRRELADTHYAAEIIPTDECVAENEFPAMKLKIWHDNREISPQFFVTKSNRPLTLNIQLGKDLGSFQFQEGRDGGVRIVELARAIMFAHESACQFASIINDRKPS